MAGSWPAWALVLSLVIGLLLAFARRQRELARLQARWGWLGPALRPQTGGRAWSGEVQGRLVQVRWFEGAVELEVQAQPLVEASFVCSGRSARLAGVQGGPSVELGSVTAYGRELALIEAMAREPGARGALAMLLGGHDRSPRAVCLQPERGVSWFACGLPQYELSPEYAQLWVEALIVLARWSERSEECLARRPV